ncbi:Hpt domain-containing protein [Sedimentitalea nanhaiensis]|uniref:Hpt domain-containing protein n=1 Tax=Sedimentitalea nanhaiensis TaxID=999627 RepID=A0A1I7DQK8_9RHOB|nr:Hpt domain-containing protein [Sedimentitalea nanhaiensis]SFU13916.1 Hpt domain-containing protein [Sedimentitalea nanhaiensis]
MIDWSRVIELRAEVGAEDFDEVIELFLEEVGEVIDRLQQGPDPENLEQDLHFLKGSALSLGFKTFSVLCQDGERKSAQGLAETVNVEQIVTEFDASKTVFLSEVKQRIAA